MRRSRILIVDDEKIFRESLYHWFIEEDYDVDAVENGFEALKIFEKDKYDILMVDLKMPGMSGMELFTKLKAIDEQLIVIMITAFATVPTAIQALKDGVFDYVTKPVDPDELCHLVEKALKHKNLESENNKLKENIEVIVRPGNLIGTGHSMEKIFEMINTVSQTDTTVLLRGESGTGKELVAKAIHANSKRKYFPLVTVNCGAVSESILESELFGHEKGSFTGAYQTRKGKFELADNGTIFLDEIGTISTKMQVELLRVIETKQFARVGGNELIHSNFRVIAATNELLEERVKEGKFREDLYYRLNVFTIFLPPLRERREDIPSLVEHFCTKLCNSMNKPVKKISKGAMDFLLSYDWKGNVRELENAIERAVVIGKGDEITVDDLPFGDNISSADYIPDETLEQVEKKHIIKVLSNCKWNISKASRTLDIDRVTLYKKIDRYGLKMPSDNGNKSL